MILPLAISGSSLVFCSSVPKLWMGYIASEPCTLANERMPESPRSSSSIARP
jgi:hypothetical protein